MSKYIVATTAKRAFEHPPGSEFTSKAAALRDAKQSAELGNREYSVWVRELQGPPSRDSFGVEYTRIATFDKDGRKVK